MSDFTRSYIVNNIALPINASSKEAFTIASGKLKRLGINTRGCELKIYRRSVDARKRNDIKFVYSVMITGRMPEIKEEALKRAGIASYKQCDPRIEPGNESRESDIIVVGSGPCGLFAALMLTEAGYNPVIIERGGSVKERNERIKRFERERILDPSTNIQFGAGGAGTFSDGKLVTRVGDPMSEYVLRRFVEFGAPEEILYKAKPHVGTDILSLVVERMLAHIEALGGRVLYHTELLDIVSRSGRIDAVRTNNGIMPVSAVILAIGHSARDTYFTLIDNGMDIVAKPFSVGMRIEHRAEMIDRAMYGDMAGSELLGHAEYTLSCNTKSRGVYTFCMCPGGTVIAAASETSGVVVNGMSRHARDGENSNCAVLASVFKEDYGGTPRAAIEFQRRIERAAFKAGGGDYSAPIITVGDFLADKTGTEPSSVRPTYMNGNGVRLAAPSSFLPKLVLDHLKLGILDFDKKIHGFASPEAVLTGAETRTSAPLRIMRSSDTRLATGYTNLYPAGEGAGYAGGITSAAIDGINTALAVIGRFKP